MGQVFHLTKSKNHSVPCISDCYFTIPFPVSCSMNWPKHISARFSSFLLALQLVPQHVLLAFSFLLQTHQLILRVPRVLIHASFTVFHSTWRVTTHCATSASHTVPALLRLKAPARLGHHSCRQCCRDVCLTANSFAAPPLPHSSCSKCAIAGIFRVIRATRFVRIKRAYTHGCTVTASWPPQL